MIYRPLAGAALLLAATSMQTGTAHAEEILSGNHFQIGIGAYAVDDIQIGNTKSETSVREVYFNYGTLRSLSEEHPIPVKIEAEAAYTRLDILLPGINVGGDMVSFGGNAVWEHDLGPVTLGLGAGIGYGSISYDYTTSQGTSSASNFVEDESTGIFKTILRFGFPVSERGSVVLGHSFVNLPGSDVFDETYSNFRLGIEYKL